MLYNALSGQKGALVVSHLPGPVILWEEETFVVCEVLDVIW